MTKNVTVLMNEQHSLLPEQEKILNSKYGKNWNLFLIPSSGWTSNQIKQKSSEFPKGTIVFCSPVPYLIKLTTLNKDYETLIFHNDNREKKELPNGKVISVVSKKGWQLV